MLEPIFLQRLLRNARPFGSCDSGFLSYAASALWEAAAVQLRQLLRPGNIMAGMPA